MYANLIKKMGNRIKWERIYTKVILMRCERYTKKNLR